MVGTGATAGGSVGVPAGVWVSRGSGTVGSTVAATGTGVRVGSAPVGGITGGGDGESTGAAVGGPTGAVEGGATGGGEETDTGAGEAVPRGEPVGGATGAPEPVDTGEPVGTGAEVGASSVLVLVVIRDLGMTWCAEPASWQPAKSSQNTDRGRRWEDVWIVLDRPCLIAHQSQSSEPPRWGGIR